MKKKNIFIIIMVIGLLLIASLYVFKYNNLISLNENVESKLSDVGVQLERRADLIPNLVNTVKGYIEHEQTIIDSIANSRTKMINATTINEKNEANNELTAALNNLYVIIENYPDLKADDSFIQLQDELAGTENRIAVARRDYNDAVMDYNKTIKSFPTNIIANMLDFEEKDYFEVSGDKTEVPDVSFED